MYIYALNNKLVFLFYLLSPWNLKYFWLSHRSISSILIHLFYVQNKLSCPTILSPIWVKETVPPKMHHSALAALHSLSTLHPDCISDFKCSQSIPLQFITPDCSPSASDLSIPQIKPLAHCSHSPLCPTSAGWAFSNFNLSVSTIICLSTPAPLSFVQCSL